MTENEEVAVLERLNKAVSSFVCTNKNVPSKLKEYHDGGDDSEYFEDGYILGKVVIFEHENCLALDIQMKHKCGEDTLWAYCMLLRQYSFMHVGQVGCGIHRFVSTKFMDRSAAFRKQYLGWAVMDIQAQFLACRFLDNIPTVNLNI